MILNQRGSSLIFFISLLSVLSMMACLVILSGKKHLKDIKELSALSLCHASLISFIKNETLFMAKTNQGIKIAFLASQSPVPQISAPAKATHKALIVAQDIRSLSRKVRWMAIKHCSPLIKLKEQNSSFYSTSLKRDFMGVAQPQKKEIHFSTRSLWNFRMPILKAKISIQNPFDTGLRILSSNNKVKVSLN